MKLELEKLALALNLPVDTLNRWIRQGRIPVKKADGLCDFKTNILTEWASKHRISLDLNGTRPAPDKSGPVSYPSLGLLLNALMAGGIHHAIAGSTVFEVLDSSVSLIPGLSEDKRVELLDKLLERESLSSTGIGKGVAVPHPRNPLPGIGEEAVIMACFLEKPVDFKSIDRLPVHVLFVMICPEVKIHLTLLSRLSFCLRDEGFVALLKSSPSVAAVLDAVKNLEERLEKGGR